MPSLINLTGNFKGYEPDNCRWATWQEQRANRRPKEKKTAARTMEQA